MKNFVKLIQQVHEERFSVVLNKIIKEKFPVAFLSIAPINQTRRIILYTALFPLAARLSLTEEFSTEARRLFLPKWATKSMALK